MGNTPSSVVDVPRALPSEPRRSKRSKVLSAITFGCGSAKSFSGGSSGSETTYLPTPVESLPYISEKNKSIFVSEPSSSSSSKVAFDSEFVEEHNAFLAQYPEYGLTSAIDDLRRTEFSRLDTTGEAYVDYMGGSLYPARLVQSHNDFLTKNVLGNTHSISNTAKLSADCTAEARRAVLSFFGASKDYTVVFTPNATGALKLVGESFPFTAGSSFVVGADSHNSVHGIRRFASGKGAKVHYIEATNKGGLDPENAKRILRDNRPRSHPALFSLTGQSNVSNSKNPLSLIKYASSLGYSTLLDAAALAPTSVIRLADTGADAMAVSFYKMFGFPTGVGALIVKKSFLYKLERPWFSGGTIDFVQGPGEFFIYNTEVTERFEDGTLNYLQLPAITEGLKFLTPILPILPLRLSTLSQWLIGSLLEIRHESNGRPVVQVLSKVPSKRLKKVGEQSDVGSTISFVVLSPGGEVLPLAFIEYAASLQRISIRTGCMCNPGATFGILGLQERMKQVHSGITKKTLYDHFGQDPGVCRVSLGLASNFQDVWRVAKMMEGMAKEEVRKEWWKLYLKAQKV